MNVREVPSDRQNLGAYWRATRRLTARTLLVWALVSFGAAIFAAPLDRIVLFGFPLGYFLGAQGSVLVFVFLAALYARAMNRLDRRHGLHEPGEE